MSDGAGKGPRVRPLDGSSIHRSIAGGLSARAAGGKGFGMLGHTDSYGRSMVARVRSGPVGCIDHFARTVAAGWGTGPWCLPEWTPDQTPINVTLWGLRASVSDSQGHLDLLSTTIDGDTWSPGTVAYLVLTDPYPTFGGRINMRWRGGPIDVWFTPAAKLSTGSVILSIGWTHSDFRGPYLSPGANDKRSGWSGNTWNGDYYIGGYIDGITLPDDLSIWWNVTFLVDEYGWYMRVWRDSVTEYAYLADTQPTDYYGPACPQGAGETWTQWEAYQNPLTDPGALHQFGLQTFGRWMNTLGGGSAVEDGAPTVLDIEYIEFTGSLCPCA